MLLVACNEIVQNEIDNSNESFLLIFQKATMLKCNQRSLPLNCFQYWGIWHTNIRKEQKDK